MKVSFTAFVAATVLNVASASQKNLLSDAHKSYTPKKSYYAATEKDIREPRRSRPERIFIKERTLYRPRPDKFLASHNEPEPEVERPSRGRSVWEISEDEPRVQRNVRNPRSPTARAPRTQDQPTEERL